jgi:GNAT superfamily N-acetyltransferase
MTIEVTRVAAEEVLALRELYRHEMGCQIVRYSWHERGWTDSYLLRLDGQAVGYGLVGGVGESPRDAIVELYLLPSQRAAAGPLFRRLAAVSRARSVEAQTNDLLLTLMLYDCAASIESETVLFHDAATTQLALPGTTFRPLSASEAVFPHTAEPVGQWAIEVAGEVVATGGILFHYNAPYGDLHMEVAEPFRRRGYGSYLVQELKRACYEMGKIPAARCKASNGASRATLQRAGFLPCARLVTGVLLPPGA